MALRVVLPSDFMSGVSHLTLPHINQKIKEYLYQKGLRNFKPIAIIKEGSYTFVEVDMEEVDVALK